MRRPCPPSPTVVVGPTAALCLSLVLAACQSGAQWQLHDPGTPDAAQRALLAEAERHYRQGEPFLEQRARIAGDPVAAWWFTRMLVRDVIFAREGKTTTAETTRAHAATRYNADEIGQTVRDDRAALGNDDAVLLEVAGHQDPLEARASAEIVRLGGAALPCLFTDLAGHPQTFNRQIGIDLIARVGAPAIGLVDQELIASPEPRRRRTAALILGAMPSGTAGVAARLDRLGADPDYRVRAGAWTALGGIEGDRAATALRRALDGDPDPFCRRAAATALSRHRSRDSALALVSYLQRCQGEHDTDGCTAAQEGLQRLAGSQGVRSAEAWRAWASAFDPASGG